MPFTPNIDEGHSFRGFSSATRLPKPKQDRGSIQPQHADVDVFGDDAPIVAELEKRFPGFGKDLLRSREQNAQADMLRSQAQRPEADGVDNSGSPFQSNRDLFTTDTVNQVRLENDINAAKMKPANITPGAKTVGKGGVITDQDMNMPAAGSSLNQEGAGIVNNKVLGRADFYRMRPRFYGR